MLNYYLETNVGKAVDYGLELVDEVCPILPIQKQQDLYFSVGTARTLRMESIEDLNAALETYEKALDFGENANPNFSQVRGEDVAALEAEHVRQLNAYRGIIYNNMGVTCTQKFILESQ